MTDLIQMKQQCIIDAREYGAEYAIERGQKCEYDNLDFWAVLEEEGFI